MLQLFFQEAKRTFAILFTTIPESLPVGVIFIALILMDMAFAFFDGGLLITHFIGEAIRYYGMPPPGYSIEQCSPWSTQSTL